MTQTPETSIQGSRDVFSLAFNRGLIKGHGGTLIESIRSRQLTSHTYNEGTAEQIYRGIVHKYYHAFRELFTNLLQKKQAL